MREREMSDSTIEDFLSGMERRVEEGTALLSSCLSDRELAAIAWPEGPPETGKPWSALSPERCEAAITERLEESN